MDALTQRKPDRTEFVRQYNAGFFSDAGAQAVACLCGSTRTAKLFDKDRYGLKSPTVVCKDCGLVFTSPRPSEAFMRDFYQSDAYRVFYEEAGESDLADRLSPKYKTESFIHATSMKHLRPTAGRKPHVLEVGAGGGWNLLPFVPSCEVTGLDYSPILCDLGRHHGITMVQGGLERLSDLPGTFDLIIANHVIEHFFDFVGSMRAMTARLAPGGVLYVGVPDIYFYDISQIQNAHNYYFSPATLAHYCGQAGLKVVESGKDDSGLHQYAVFRPGEGAQPPSLGSEYQTISRKHRDYSVKNAISAVVDAVGLRAVVRAALRRS